MERQINGPWVMQKRSHENHIAICIVLPDCIAIYIVVPYFIAKIVVTLLTR